MKSPEFDKDGYPTPDTLSALRRWPVQDVSGALDFIAAGWRWPDHGVSREISDIESLLVDEEPGDRFLRLATGGWSGNEELLAALNRVIYAISWQLSSRGGLHIFRYPKVKP